MTANIEPDEVVLEPDSAIGTIADCLSRPDVNGAFDDYLFCAENGRRVLLGHQESPPVTTTLRSHSSTFTNAVFLSKQDRQPRYASTWEDLRLLLAEGWVMGTARYPGIKICFLSTGRNSRREPDRLLVLPS